MERIRLAKLSEDYFEFMARAYPVMCLSDEFYSFPRASKAIQYINCLDSLDEEKIKQDISYIRTLKRSLEKLNVKKMDLETQIDWQLLKQSMTGFLREFQQIRIWQSDPNLYLKIIILGIEQIMNKLSMIKTDIHEELTSRIKQIPRVLGEAKTNLKKIPLLYQETAIQMTEAIIDYLKNQPYLSLREDPKLSEVIKLSKRAIQSLDDFKKFLKMKPSGEEFIRDKEILEDLLTSSFSYKRSLGEIFEIASDEYQNTKIQLKRAASNIRPSWSWQRILSDYKKIAFGDNPGTIFSGWNEIPYHKLKAKNTNVLLNLYSAQIIDLKNFLIKNGVISIPKMQNIKVLQTPGYLAPIRASASYSCPITQNQRESAFFM